MVAQLIDEKGTVSEIETKFGLRKFEARGNRLYLNIHPIYLDGILLPNGNIFLFPFGLSRAHMPTFFFLLNS